MGGGYENEVIEKMAGDPMLPNIIAKAHKNKNKLKRWALYQSQSADRCGRVESFTYSVIFLSFFLPFYHYLDFKQ